MTCSVLGLQHITALWEGFFPMTELCCVCHLGLLPVPHFSPPLPTHGAFATLDKKRWRANVSQTAPEHLRVLWPQKGLCRDLWLEGTAGHWAAVAAEMFDDQQRGLKEV